MDIPQLGELNCVQVLAIILKVTVNIHREVFVDMSFHVPEMSVPERNLWVAMEACT